MSGLCQNKKIACDEAASHFPSNADLTLHSVGDTQLVQQLARYRAREEKFGERSAASPLNHEQFDKLQAEQSAGPPEGATHRRRVGNMGARYVVDRRAAKARVVTLCMYFGAAKEAAPFSIAGTASEDTA